MVIKICKVGWLNAWENLKAEVAKELRDKKWELGL